MKIFTTNCTLSPELAINTTTTTYNFVSSPNTRGTLDILWSSLSTLLLCVWTIQHLNVPPQIESHNPHRRTRVQTWRRELLWIYGSKLKWMVTTLLAPEYLIGKSVVDFLSAWWLLGRMGEWAERDGVEWTLSHVFLANIGGFVVRFGHCEGKVERKLGQDDGNGMGLKSVAGQDAERRGVGYRDINAAVLSLSRSDEADVVEVVPRIETKEDASTALLDAIPIPSSSDLLFANSENHRGEEQTCLAWSTPTPATIISPIIHDTISQEQITERCSLLKQNGI
jgi:hypothetical protein